MNEKIVKLIDKSERNIEVAEKLIKDNELEIAVSRLYYAMFYCAEALLLSKNLSFSSHKAVIVNFGKEFVKTGIFDEKFHKVLQNAFEDRQEADYEFVEFEKSEVEEYLNLAKEFLETAKKYLEIKS
jgi:uncharacterized protein (UPF0332 family)